MIVCDSCAFDNDDDDRFCGSCGSPLEWTGRKVAQDASASRGVPHAAPAQGGESQDAAAPLPGPQHPPAHTAGLKTAPGEQAPVEAAAGQEAQPEADDHVGGDTPDAHDERHEADSHDPLEAEVAATAHAEAPQQVRREAEDEARVQAVAADKARRAAALVARETGQAAVDVPAVSSAWPGAVTETLPEPTAALGAPTPGAPTTSRDSDVAPPRAPTDGFTARHPVARQPAARPPTKLPRNKKQKLPEEGPPLPPGRRYRPGDLICGECGEGNRPERKFCGKCGTSLADVEVARGSWWRRLVQRLRRPARAGTRQPRERRRTVKKVIRRVRQGLYTVLAVGVLLGVLAAAGPWRSQVMATGKDLVARVLDFFAPQYDEVSAAKPVMAEAEADHPADHVVDGIKDTYWHALQPGPQALHIPFAQPVRIDKVGFLSGAAGEPQDFTRHARPEQIQLVFSNGATQELKLRNTREFQLYDVTGAVGVEWLRIEVLSVYPGQDDQPLAITEIQFHAKRPRR